LDLSVPLSPSRAGILADRLLLLSEKSGGQVGGMYSTNERGRKTKTNRKRKKDERVKVSLDEPCRHRRHAMTTAADATAAGRRHGEGRVVVLFDSFFKNSIPN